MKNPVYYFSGGNLKKFVALCCVLSISSSVVAPTAAVAQDLPIEPPKVNVRTGPTKVNIFQPQLNLPDNPTDDDIITARVFTESLKPLKNRLATPGENQKLREALLAYRAKNNPEDSTDLESFISAFPNSRWRPALELSLGKLRFETGYFSEALKYYKSSWEQLKDERELEQSTLASEALADLMVLSARLGKREELAGYLQQSKGRALRGSTEEKIDDARTGFTYMEKQPAVAYKCGPYALNSLLNSLGKIHGRHPVIENAASTHQGTNLFQLRIWAKQCGLDLQIAKRAPGAAVLVPAVVHWKVGHFGAIVGKHQDRFHITDPTFDTEGNFWIKEKALDSESDGYYLVLPGTLPMGWQPVSDEEGRAVWGKGEAKGRNQDEHTKGCPKCEECNKKSGPMAEATAFKMLATLTIEDTPLAYSPPIGPNMDFNITYNHLETNQPALPAFPTFGPDWVFNWISYLTVDASGNATVRVRGGGSEVFNFIQPNNITNPFAPDLISQAVLKVTGKNSYERQLPDGSIEVFDQTDGAGRIFMTKVLDPQGNAATITYNSNFRIDAITDAIGQVTTLSYLSNSVANPNYYKISQISDPFSRTATFAWDASNIHIVGITDVINLQSTFNYDPASSFILSMGTPYGVTSFQNYVPKSDANHINANRELARGFRITYPDGTGMVLENWLNFEQRSYFWDRHAMELYPGDPGSNVYSHCEQTQWQMIHSAPILESSVPDWVKPPLESQISYEYEGEEAHSADLHYTGVSNRPISITRTIEGGVPQTSTFEYNAFGLTTKSVDPLGRTFLNYYAANNVDLLESREASSNALLGKWQYNEQHLPLVQIDGSGQVTQYEYNSEGQLLPLTDPKGKVTEYGYTLHYLTSIDGPLTGDKDKTTIIYDGFGRPYRVTDSVGYVLEYQYDAANRVTKIVYPDGTSDDSKYEKLDQIASKDRIGRWTTSQYNSMDELIKTTDPLGRTAEYVWCSCGSLVTLKDGAGNVTHWHHDLEGRTIEKEYANGSSVTFEYEGTATSGRLKRRTDALNQKTDYSYNLDDTLQEVSYSDLAVANSTSDVTLTWDPVFRRIATVQNGWGTLTYSYNNYITNPYGTKTTGGGMLHTVANNVIANSTIEYFYDELGRTSKREIDGANNRITWVYDAMSRVTSEVNALGTFNYHYVDESATVDRGTTRLSSIDYPNGQDTFFSYYGNLGDQRLQRISNLNSSGGILSEFDYAYDPSGQITQWQQTQNGNKLCYNLGYDLAGQLTRAQAGSGSPAAPYAKENYYSYDSAANRTAVQTSSVDTLRIGGTKTTNDVLTVTVFDSSLSGGQKAVNYTVLAADTLTTIASGLAAAITNDTSLRAIGVNAAPASSSVKIRSTSRNITTYSTSLSGGATETLAFKIHANGIEHVIIGGTKTTSDTVTLTIKDAALPGGQQTVSRVVQPADTLITIADALKNSIQANSNITGAGITATSGSSGSNGLITMKSTSQNVTSYAQSVSGTGGNFPTETVSLLMNSNVPYFAEVGGSVTTNDIVTIQIYDSGLPGGTQSVSRTVVGGDTLTSIASAITTSINGNSNLQAARISATSSGSRITLTSESLNPTSYRKSVSGARTETVIIVPRRSSTQTLILGGTKTTGNSITITAFDVALAGGSKAVSYTILAGDADINAVAAKLATAINADVSLQAIGVSATATANVVNIFSQSLDETTYTKATSGGATITVALPPSVGTTQSTYNNVNELTSLVPGGGAVLFEGTTTKPVKSATVGSEPARLNWSQNLSHSKELPSNTSNQIFVSATDAASNNATSTYQVITPDGTTLSPTYDLNGNMTSDGVNSFVWDAENRLIRINYPGSGNNSQFTYDGSGRNVKILETTAGSVTSTKQFVWEELEMCEERNAAGGLTNQFFDFGELPNSNARFYFCDGLDSVREMTDASGVIKTENLYDPWGRITSVGVEAANKAFAALYVHLRSGLEITPLRLYSPVAGRWLSRDPAEEEASLNLYAYVENDPVGYYDQYGAKGSNSRRYPRRSVPINCYSVSCCQDMRDRCADLCLVRWTLHLAIFHATHGVGATPPPKYGVGALNHCRGCCSERKGWCNRVVSRGRGRKPFPTSNFNCPQQCLED